MSQGRTQYAWLAGPRCCAGTVGVATGNSRDGSTYKKRGMGRILDDTGPIAWPPLNVHLQSSDASAFQFQMTIANKHLKLSCIPPILDRPVASLVNCPRTAGGFQEVLDAVCSPVLPAPPVGEERLALKLQRPSALRGC